MLISPITMRIPKMALYVFVFVVFAVGSGEQKVQASCGDYLTHSRLRSNKALSEWTHESLPVPSCKGGNCRSAPSLPPVEPSRIVFPQWQPLDFQSADTSNSLHNFACIVQSNHRSGRVDPGVALIRWLPILCNSNLLFTRSYHVCFFTSNLNDFFLLGSICVAFGFILFSTCRMARRCFQRASMEAIATL